MKAFPELTAALREMLDRMDASLRDSGYDGPPVLMFLAGGVAVNYYCGTRYTEDVDASFSRRFVLPKDLTLNYRRRDGREGFIYFDQNYNTSFALLHENFEENARSGRVSATNPPHPASRPRTPRSRRLQTGAFFRTGSSGHRGSRDRMPLHAAELRRHATEAMGNTIGDKRPLLTSLKLICRGIAV
jgi:hypothetical protein